MTTAAYNLASGQTRQPPKLNLNFQSASLDPRVVVTRAGATATRINSSGLVATVAADTARFDYDLTTLACKGLLIEETRTNICNRSESFITGWGSFGGTYTNNAGTAPDGTNNATSVTNTNSGAFRYWPFSATGTYTVSVWAKGATGTETITLQSAPSGASTGPLPLTTSWQRFTFTYTGSWSRFDIYLGGTSQLAYFWGAQVEAGAFATSYIPATAGSNVTRNADDVLMSGTNFTDWYNATQGTLFAQCLSPASGTRAIFDINDASAANSISLQTAITVPTFKVVTASSQQASVTAGTTTANAQMSAYASYAPAFFGISRGSNRQIVTSGTVPTTSRMQIGADASGNYLCGHMQKLQFWP